MCHLMELLRVSQANAVMLTEFTWHRSSTKTIYISLWLSLKLLPHFITMKLNRDYLVLALCFIFLACGLGLVATVVALSPSLGLFNGTTVYVPEDTQRQCLNCTIVLISTGTIVYRSMPTLYMLIGMTLATCSFSFI